MPVAENAQADVGCAGSLRADQLVDFDGDGNDDQLIADTVQLDLDGDGNPDWAGHDVDGDGYADVIAVYSTVDGQWHTTPGPDLEPAADDAV